MVYSIFLNVWLAFCHVSNRFSAMQLNSGSGIFTFHIDSGEMYRVFLMPSPSKVSKYYIPCTTESRNQLDSRTFVLPLPSLHTHRGRILGCRQWSPLCHPQTPVAASSLRLALPWVLAISLGWMEMCILYVGLVPGIMVFLTFKWSAL